LSSGLSRRAHTRVRGGRVKCNGYSQLTDLTVDKNKAKTSMRE
jgi:hypothetical protein